MVLVGALDQNPLGAWHPQDIACVDSENELPIKIGKAHYDVVAHAAFNLTKRSSSLFPNFQEVFSFVTSVKYRKI